jgi:hypothetical protein
MLVLTPYHDRLLLVVLAVHCSDHDGTTKSVLYGWGHPANHLSPTPWLRPLSFSFSPSFLPGPGNRTSYLYTLIPFVYDVPGALAPYQCLIYSLGFDLRCPRAPP